MTLRKTLPRNKWWSGLFWFDHKQYKERLTNNWPEGLVSFYLSTNNMSSTIGSISWDGTPTIGADGVEPGHGPLAAPVFLASGKVIAVRVKMDKSSTGLTGDEQIFGPIYARNGNVVLKWQGSEDAEAASWDIGATLAIRADVVTGALNVEVLA